MSSNKAKKNVLGPTTVSAERRNPLLVGQAARDVLGELGHLPENLEMVEAIVAKATRALRREALPGVTGHGSSESSSDLDREHRAMVTAMASSSAPEA